MNDAQVAEAREAVAAASRKLAEEGLVLGTAGNVSARVDEEHFAISPTGAVLEQLAADQVPVVDASGDVVAGELAPTSELDLHLGVYERYDAGAVVHTHAPLATALSCVIEELPPVHYGMLVFGGAVRVAPYKTFGTPELAAGVLDALEGKTVALMANHGAIAYGASVDAAVDLTLQLEWACSVYWHARQIGEPRVLSQEELEAVVSAVVERGYGATQRLEDKP